MFCLSILLITFDQMPTYLWGDHMPKYLEIKKRKPHKALITLQASLRDMTSSSISF